MNLFHLDMILLYPTTFLMVALHNRSTGYIINIFSNNCFQVLNKSKIILYATCCHSLVLFMGEFSTNIRLTIIAYICCSEKFPPPY